MTPRTTNQTLVLLRRSSDQQATSFEKQFNWAVKRAQELNLTLDATFSDLQFMLTQRLHSHKCLRVDDAISGNTLDRPGFNALVHDALTDRQISHILVFARDRLSRSESSGLMVDFEQRMLKRGITLIIGDQVLVPGCHRQHKSQRVEALMAYENSHDFLVNLAQQMLDTQRVLAGKGFTTGGTPPYGFVRRIYDEMGQKVLEVLPRGRSVQQQGCHVVWLPDEDHPERLQTWINILAWRESGLGPKSIARKLNQEGKPAPNAGLLRKRRDGHSYLLKNWTAGSVRALIKNPLITGQLSYGRRSEGKLLRWAGNGSRELTESDLNHQEIPRTIDNDPSLHLTREAHFPPLFDRQRWERIQALGGKRSKCQRGIRRSPKPERYPLSCRVFDLTEDTPRPMFGRMRDQHAIYFCSTNVSAKNAPRYHEVDGEALFRYATKRLQFEYGLFGLREELYRKLLARAQRDQAAAPHPAAPTRKGLDRKLRDAESKILLAGKNLLQVRDAELIKICEQEFAVLRQERDRVKAELRTFENQPSQPRTAEMAADQALQLLDTLERISIDPNARIEAAGLFNKLNFRTGLYFKPAILGKKRLVNRLAAGVFTLGNAPFPRPSKNSVPNSDYTDSRTGEPHVREVQSVPHQGKEMISYNKVCRGDRI
jgi:hypothetical protein